MKSKWKGLLFMSLLAGAVLATGCGGQKSADQGSGSGKQPTMGVAIYKYDDTFMTGVRDAINKAGEGKAKIEMVDSQNSQATQNDKVDLFISKKVNALGINIVDRTAAGVIVDKAKNANIPVVFMNREPLPEAMNAWDKTYYVGAKAEQSGTLSGEILAEYFKKNPTKTGTINYVLLMGEPGHQDAELRSKYAPKALTDAGFQVNEIARDFANWDRVKGQEKMAAFIAAYGDKIDAVIANNDDMALGAIEALKAAGYFQNGKFIPVVGVDCTAPALKSMKDGEMLGTVLNDAKNQGKAVYSLMDVLARGEVPTKDNVGFDISDGKYIWIPYIKVTRENMADIQL